MSIAKSLVRSWSSSSLAAGPLPDRDLIRFVNTGRGDQRERKVREANHVMRERQDCVMNQGTTHF